MFLKVVLIYFSQKIPKIIPTFRRQDIEPLCKIWFLASLLDSLFVPKLSSTLRSVTSSSTSLTFNLFPSIHMETSPTRFQNFYPRFHVLSVIVGQIILLNGQQVLSIKYVKSRDERFSPFLANISSSILSDHILVFSSHAPIK